MDDTREINDLATAFATTAKEHAERVALVEEHGSITYAELDALVDRMARRLLDHGAGPGELVALHCDPTAVTLAWLLAIHRVGAAYLPLHTQADPVSAFKILDDARPVLLVSDRDHPGLAEICPSWPPTPTRTRAGRRSHRAAPGARADDPAYVIYTSGTTGEPKGVIVTHGNYLALKRATDTLMDFGPDDRWVLYHDTAFDFSVWEIFGALLSGGSLVIPDRYTIISPPLFATLVAEKGVTVLNQTPTAFSRNRLALDREGANRSLRYVIFGGERLTRKVWEPWVQDQGFEAPALINMYGITETTVHVTFHQLDRPTWRPPTRGSAPCSPASSRWCWTPTAPRPPPASSTWPAPRWRRATVASPTSRPAPSARWPPPATAAPTTAPATA